MEKTLGITQARQRFSDIIDQVKHQKVNYLIIRHGKPAAALVPIEVYEKWKREREEFFAAIHAIQDRNQDADPDEVMRLALEAQQAVRSSAQD